MAFAATSEHVVGRIGTLLWGGGYTVYGSQFGYGEAEHCGVVAAVSRTDVESGLSLLKRFYFEGETAGFNRENPYACHRCGEIVGRGNRECRIDSIVGRKDCKGQRVGVGGDFCFF